MLNKIPIPKSIILLTILAFVLNILRVILFGKFSFIYILWNLLLAFIPFFISYFLLFYFKKDNYNKIIFIIGFILWFLFIPNAPYIITDFIHLGEIRSVPVIYDIFLIFSSALAGLFVGFHSFFHIEKIIKTKYSARANSVIMGLIILITSFGMYLGRFFRFNSWDIFTTPLDFFNQLFRTLFTSTYHIEALVYILLFFFFIYISYISWKYSIQND